MGAASGVQGLTQLADGCAGASREESQVAVTKKPAYVMRQKEQQRLARATERRAARRDRKHSSGTESEDLETQDAPAEDMETDAEAAD